MATQAAELARLATLIEGMSKQFDKMSSELQAMHEKLDEAERKLERLSVDMADVKPVTQMVSSYKSMALGALGVLGLFGGSMYAFWRMLTGQS